MLSQLQAGEFIYEQPTTGDVEYIFKHALTQEVAYNALLVERRKLLHERTGPALELMFVGKCEESSPSSKSMACTTAMNVSLPDSSPDSCLPIGWAAATLLGG
jgi:hypothetical protein